MNAKILSLTIFLFLFNSLTGDAQIIRNLLREGKRGAKNIGKTFEKGANDVYNTTGDVVHDVTKTTGTAATDIRKTVEKGLFDASVATGKAGKDLVEETKRVKYHTMDVGIAIKKFIESNAKGNVDAWTDAAKRLSEGKVVDMFFHLALDPLTAQEEAAFNATQESGWLNTIGATAATAYGGPGGAAAYASWQTYKASGGNVELALRAGIIAGIASNSLEGIGTMDGSTAFQMMKKSVLAGSVGGIAIAASGGSSDDIRDGFIKGGGMVLVQDMYQNYTGHILDPRGATEEPYPVDSKTLAEAYYYDENGNLQLNTAKLSHRAQHVGKGATPFDPANTPTGLAADNSWLMRTVGQVPGFNAMGLFHDKWTLSWLMANDLRNQATIFPALVLTYRGTDAELIKAIATEVTASNESTRKPRNVPENPQGPSNSSGNFDIRIPGSFGDARNTGGQIFNNSQLDTLPSGYNGLLKDYKKLAPIEKARQFTYCGNWDCGSMENYFAILHAYAPYRSIIYLRNALNGKTIRTTVDGVVSEEDKAAGLTIRLSKPAADFLGTSINGVYFLETEYEDVTVNSLTITPNGDNIDEGLVFSNLRNEKWKLNIWDMNSQLIYSYEEYKNNMTLNPPTGTYTLQYSLVNISPGQILRDYSGSFFVVKK